MRGSSTALGDDGAAPSGGPGEPGRQPGRHPQDDVERSVRRHLHRAMALPVVVLALSSCVLVALVLYLQNLNRWVDHTDVVLGRANHLQKLTVERESALRGYLLTRDQRFLDHYNAADRQLSPLFDVLQDLVADDSVEIARLRSARVEVIRGRHHAAQQVDRVRDGASAEELVARLPEGMAIDADILSRLEEFIRNEERLRDYRVSRADAVTRFTLMAGMILGVLLGTAVAFATARQMKHVKHSYLGALADQQRTERALEEANHRLRQADRRKDEFLSMLSHELRNPLAPIRSAVYLLERADPRSDEAARARTIIGRQVEHMARLVDDLLDVKRLSVGKMRLRLERMDLVKPARAMVEDLRASFVQRGLVLRFEAPPCPLWVKGDETRLAQVVGNLLDNAAKFTDPGGQVCVTVENREASVHLRVRDEGVGMAPELAESLFEPFVQAESTLDRSGGGLGLGLALVRGIVKLHGGTVVARSGGLGKGTEFDVTLPAAQRPETPAVRRAAPAPARRRCILVVEDNEDAAASLRDVLEIVGDHEVHVASDGLAGIEAVDRLQPEVVLCDLGLPVLDGYEVARRIRADPGRRGVALIAISGYASAEDVERSSAAGFGRHVAKPVDLDELLRVIAELP